MPLTMVRSVAVRLFMPGLVFATLHENTSRLNSTYYEEIVVITPFFFFRYCASL